MPETADSSGSETALRRAVLAVPAARFLGEDGRAVRPCTPAAVTHRHLGMLDVRPGADVLDIGLGSGLSAALLAQLAGPGGQVTAVEIDARLASRAEALYAEHGHRVNVVVGDGLGGHAPGAPYDRILAGTTPPAVPDVWLRQLRPGGVLLCGVRICDLPSGYAVARITAGGEAGAHRIEVHHGGYMPMVAPERPEDVTRAAGPGDGDRCVTVLGRCGHATAAAYLDALADGRYTGASPAEDGEWYHLKNWLMAVEPAGLLEATLERGNGIGIGRLADDGTAHAALVTGGHLFADGPRSPALEALTALVDRWHADGAPRTHGLRAALHPDGGSWHVRVSAPRR